MNKKKVLFPGLDEIEINFEFGTLPKGSSDVVKTGYKNAVENMGETKELNIPFKFNPDKLKNESPIVVYNVFYWGCMYTSLFQ